jgi:hypothetical protein
MGEVEPLNGEPPDEIEPLLTDEVNEQELLSFSELHDTEPSPKVPNLDDSIEVTEEIAATVEYPWQDDPFRIDPIEEDSNSLYRSQFRVYLTKK